VLGVLPYLHGLHLEAEDALPDNRHSRERGNPVRTSNRFLNGNQSDNLDSRIRGNDGIGRLRVAVPVLPRISNHTDFDALRLHPGVDFRFIGLDETPPPADLIVLPGSKSVRADLAALRERGWAAHLQRHLRYGGKLLGICGGFQMLGRAIHDPLGIEGAPGSSPALSWLEMETTLAAEKQLRNVAGRLAIGDAGEVPVSGYEIHAGVSTGPALERPLAWLGGQPDGALTEDIAGTYLHGLFDTAAAADALLAWAGLSEARAPDIQALREAAIERLADAVESHLDTQTLLHLLS